jgi:hypothetical protein
MNTTTFALIEFFTLSGLGFPKEGQIVKTGTLDEVNKAKMSRTFFNKITGDSDYTYQVTKLKKALRIMVVVNRKKERAVKLFRHQVYGEVL